MLVQFLSEVILKERDGGEIRILEVGGGFGGTSTALIKLLSAIDRPTSYTFTDISPKLVKDTKAKFLMHSWMDFQTLSLEDSPAQSLQGKFDIVIGTNVVHATSDVVRSCSRIKSLLREGGIMALSEVICKIDWYDLVFGLLEGWWCFKDGRDYPLQPADFWLQCLGDAGFNERAVSGGSNAEALTQSIILGCKTSRPPRSINYQGPNSSIPPLPERSSPQDAAPSEYTINQPNTDAKKGRDLGVSTVAYKKVGNLLILADIFYPQPGEMVNARPIGKIMTKP